MTEEIKKLLKGKNAINLRELSEKIVVSYAKVRNISCGRTAFKNLYTTSRRYEIYPKKTKKLAYLIGIILGDGNIFSLKRCQRLLISCDRKYPRKIVEIKKLVFDIFKKKPKIYKRSSEKCDTVCLYMQKIDKALGLKIGNKIKNKVRIPNWILRNKRFLIGCLKGLFETDGNYSENKKFHVQFIEFENRCRELRMSVYNAIKGLGYNPQLGNRYVRLARRTEVVDFINKIDYGKY